MTRESFDVQIVVSDPWEFVVEVGENAFAGSVALRTVDHGREPVPGMNALTAQHLGAIGRIPGIVQRDPVVGQSNGVEVCLVVGGSA